MQNQEKNSPKKFLQFYSKKIYFTTSEGVWWIAIKPICDALGVDYNRQFQNLKEDKILGQLFAIQQMVAADGRLRKMVCLPEFFVYGWMFSINSDSPHLQEYKWKCYELLYNYFHGVITERTKILKEKTETELEMLKLEQQLQQNETYQRLIELRQKASKAKASLTQWDREVVNQQLILWQQEAMNSSNPQNAAL